MQASFAKLNDGSWGVKLAGNTGEATGKAGTTVTVRKRDGTSKQVTLGPMVMQWNAGRAAVYAAVDRGRPTVAAMHQGSRSRTMNLPEPDEATALDDHRITAARNTIVQALHGLRMEADLPIDAAEETLAVFDLLVKR